ncbi:MAG: T9SS type A sorting domain-containing protein [Bacteroidetes bacterium]|nr:T9SS type A sorting domain-containing protein [Bacteroidota bacterium]
MKTHTHRDGRSITASRAWIAFVVLLLCCVNAGTAQAQWEPEMRLTSAPDSSQSSGSFNALAVSGDTVHVVWADRRSGDWEIYYKRSVDDGVSWGDDVRISTNGKHILAYRPMASIAVSGSKVHVVWHNERTGEYEVYYRRSMDGGSTWDAEECLYCDVIRSWMPSIAAHGNTVHVAWADFRDGYLSSLYHIRSTDDGHTWSEARRLSGTAIAGYAQSARISVTDARVYVSWHYYFGGTWKASYTLSTDGGDTWWDENNPAGDPSGTDYLTIQQSYPYIYYLWSEKESSLWNLHYRHSTDAGLRWQQEGSLRLQQVGYLLYSYAAAGPVLHLAWRDEVNGLGVIRYSCSTDAGAQWGEFVEISPFDTGANFPTIARSGSTLHLVWTDYRDGAGEIYYRRNPTGNPVSVENDDVPLPADIVLEQNYPNPFSGSSSMRFTVPERSRAILTLHDPLGRTVATIGDREYEPGTHSARIDAAALPAGNYLCRLTCGGQMRTRMITVLR